MLKEPRFWLFLTSAKVLLPPLDPLATLLPALFRFAITWAKKLNQLLLHLGHLLLPLCQQLSICCFPWLSCCYPLSSSSKIPKGLIFSGYSSLSVRTKLWVPLFYLTVMFSLSSKSIQSSYAHRLAGCTNLIPL